jgi:hypothetical protein
VFKPRTFAPIHPVYGYGMGQQLHYDVLIATAKTEGSAMVDKQNITGKKSWGVEVQNEMWFLAVFMPQGSHPHGNFGFIPYYAS